MHDAPMQSPIPSARAELETAEAELRTLLVGDFRQNAKEDASSLDRILVHIGNIHQAIDVFPDRRANAAKRLEDFAAIAARMTRRHPAATDQLSRLATALRTASLQFRELALVS
jgi:hypothetical protein